MKKLDPSHISNIVEKIYQVFPDAWLYAGNLLGLIRDNKLLDWEGDIDFGIMVDEFDEEKLELLESLGIYFGYSHPYDHPKLREYDIKSIGSPSKVMLKDQYKNNIELCLFTEGKPLERNGRLNEMLYYAVDPNRLFVMPKDTIYPLVEKEYLGTIAKIPKNYEEHLSFLYGKDWNTEKPNWYFTADFYLMREHTHIELDPDDGSKWNKYHGRRVIEETFGKQDFPDDINTPFVISK